MYSSAFVPHFCRHSFFFFCACYGDHRDLHSFPTRRSSDLDSAGYAVAEISIDDYVLHGRSRTTQSVVWVSSTDPWHRAADIDRSMEQPGFDLVFGSGLTHGLEMLTPVSLLYGTPEDAAAEIRFLPRRGDPATRGEVGE